MIEKPPKQKQDDGTFSLMVKLQFEGTLKNIQDEYLYWDKIKYKIKDNKPEEFWNAIKLYRMIKSNTVTFGKYNFRYMITDYMQRALHQFDMHIGGTLGSNTGIAETDKTKFILSSITEEAISSSQMEGANTTRKKAKEMIQQEQKPKNRSEQMIMNNFITMKHIVQYKNEEITPEKILYIHQLISNKTLDNSEDEGKFRDNDEVYVVNHVNSEVVHTPPPSSELDELITDLCNFFNHESENFIHPIIKGCIIHFMTGWIHPFTDGNGRTARALFYWYMLKNGYWMTEYLSISRIIKDTKNQYEKAYLYTEIDDNDLSYFLTYHIQTMEKAYDALKEYISRKQKEVFQAARFMKIPFVNERMAQVLKIVNDDPERILHIKEIEKRFLVSNFTARTDLKMLVELGFLEIIQVNKKKQAFIKSGKFEEILKQQKL
ncbi:MAG: cell filamentation protein Fic [Bacteroidetes bacterium GWF2_42_66]|nr:MAG: cell filamentation protein Fic [Bacteroidetes bacterium GWA2_42_15]OFX96768.1 MAG: cell filamentation protein Fic [Bacteroidetes bacterium GWE2_42_39]OFY45460.1 MAG: cell filamentation protein Fic [Bacteroidetes bacterium GWF2_42_66]HBL76155.1 cell filamentation protein Fic [Prolixibacteraceae bacterium]HCR91564.1 cell filamentation protein Fic [Prolixibacteraceae bacterium]